MAIQIDTQDLTNYPGNVKRVTLDQEQIVSQGYEGDEQFMLSFSTTAYSDNTTNTRIQDSYVTYFRAGWCKSSGFAGTKFALDSTHNAIEVKLGATVSGVSDGFYRIILEHNDGIPIEAEVVAADIETKIRAIANTLADDDIGFRLSYMNASVEFKGGRFWIVSGSLGQFYSGSNRSSVQVRSAAVNGCSELLGFNLDTNSEDIDGQGVKEALVLTDYVATVSGVGQITISSNIGAQVNDCMLITDRVNSEYFQIDNIIGGTMIEFDSSRIINNYEQLKTKVQLLREQDPDADPTLWFNDIDKIHRHGLKTIINQIDYSS